MTSQIYFIAIIPPEAIREEVTQFKIDASRHFKASHALKSPPHITLIPPFSWEKEAQYLLSGTLIDFVATQQPFSVKLRQFDHFDHRVLFVDVVQEEDLLDIQQKLESFLKDQLDLYHEGSRPYHPHMTIAFKDLKPEVFPDAWAYFSQLSFERDFLADRLFLLKHDGDRWQIIQEIELGKNINNNL